MNRIVILAAAIVGCLGASSTPNIIVFLADDVGYGDWPNHPTMLTPNLDKLANSGMRFTQFYTAYSICTPSRSGMLTGRLPVRSGVYSKHDPPVLDNVFRVFTPNSYGSLPATEITLGNLLRKAGYSTGLVGKWHLGTYNNSLPLHRGFDYYYGIPYAQDEGCPPEPCHSWQHLFPGVPLIEGDTIIEQPVDLNTLTPRYNDKATAFVDRALDKKQPFFLYFAYDEAHIPLFASNKFMNTSRRGLYGDAVAEMDDSIGRMMEHLKARGELNNTLVVFSSDNGAWTGQGLSGGSNGLFRGGKGSTWEGGYRMPCVFSWADHIPAGTVNQKQASLMDLFATFAEVADVPVPTDRVLDSVSLLPILLDAHSSSVPRDSYIFYRQHTVYAIRTGAYKAHFLTRPGFGDDHMPEHHDPPLLFNLEHDPAEALPLNATQYPDVLARVNDILKQHESTLVKGEPQLDHWDWTFSICPCCNKTTKCHCNNEFNPYVTVDLDLH